MQPRVTALLQVEERTSAVGSKDFIIARDITRGIRLVGNPR